MSGRIRSIKPEWLEDELLVLASSDARTLSIALILLADDYGNGRANPHLLASRIFPRTPRVLPEALAELVRMRFVALYEVDGQHYYSIRNWEKHQRVDKPGKPKVPPPSNAPAKIPESPEKITDVVAIPRASRDPFHSLPDPDPDPDPDPERRVPCPRKPLTAEQVSRLELDYGCRPDDAERLCVHFSGKWAGDPPKPAGEWRKRMWTAVTTTWRNRDERKRVLGEPDPVEDPNAQRDRDARDRMEARDRARRERDMASPPIGAAERANLKKVIGGIGG